MTQSPKSNMAGPSTPVRFRYKNHEGKTRVRLAIIKRIFFATTKWHKEPQWFLRAHCVEHKADRDFALADCDFLSFSANADPNELEKLIVAHPTAIDPRQYDEQIKKTIESKIPHTARENSLPPIENLKQVEGNERNTEEDSSSSDSSDD